jgi:hypothetical protein
VADSNENGFSLVYKFGRMCEDDIDGHLVIQHFHFGKKKIISLKKKISEEHYLKYFEPEFQRFRRTSVVDYEAFNRLIKKNIDDLSCFGVVRIIIFHLLNILKKRNSN